jgi:hypothetical protein
MLSVPAIDLPAVADPINAHSVRVIVQDIQDAIVASSNTIAVRADKLRGSGRPRIRLEVIDCIGDSFARIAREVAVFSSGTRFYLDLIGHFRFLPPDSFFTISQA